MKRWLVGIVKVLAGLLALILLFLLGTNVVSYVRGTKTYAIPTTPISLPADSASMARGKHLATAVMLCADCHGPDLGGTAMTDDPMFGKLVAPNLTTGKGGFLSSHSNEDFARSVRHGVGDDGKSLIFMPSEAFQSLRQDDLAAIIAYVRSVPPVDSVSPATRVGPLARTLHVLVGLPLMAAELVVHDAPSSTVETGVTLAYGEYLGATCRGCHGPTLAGGAGPGPNITPGMLGSWTEADFFRAMREGKRPDGTTITAEMPWKSLSGMTDDELRALWLYVRSVPAQSK